MRRVVGFLVVLCVAMPVAARAGTPEQLFRRILADPGFMFHQTHRTHPHALPTQPPDTPLVDVPMPHLRPGEDARLAYQSEEPRIVAAPLAPAPLPRISTADAPALITAAPPATTAAPLAAATPPVPPVPTPRPAAPPTQLAALEPPAATIAPAPLSPGGSVCSPELSALGVSAQPLPAIATGACGMPDPVKVTAVADGKVTIDGNATVDCAVAEKLGRFVTETVEPKADEVLHGRVTALRILDSYTCRNRDGLADAKLSEHAHGNAIDIGAFQIDGKRWITVGDSGNGVEENTFLVAVRQAACGPFTTVLGPGADSYHAGHFHLDLIQRRTAGPSHGLYCR
jgi:hypothetical protein